MTNDESDEPQSSPRQPKMDGGMSMSFGMPSKPTDAGNEHEASMRVAAPAIELRPSPFRVVVMDEFCGDATPPERAQLVTAASIDDAMSNLGVRIHIAVTNHLASKPAELTAQLRFGSMRDFRPKLLLAQVPELRAVCTLHERLDDLGHGRITAAQLEAELESVQGMDALLPALQLALEKPASALPTVDDQQAAEGRKLLNELLDMAGPSAPPEPTPPAGPPRSALDGAIRAIAGGGGSGGRNRSGAAEAMELVGKLLAAQLAEIVGATEVRKLEAAWRGLHFLTTQASGRDGLPVRIEILHATPDTFAEVFADQVYEPECDEEPEHALSLSVIGCAMHNNAAQLQAIRSVQDQSEELQAPLLWSMAPDFLGERVQQLAKRDSVRAVLDGDGLAKWQGLRSDETSRWSSACYNRFLLRLPHEGQIGPCTFAETVQTDDDHLWGAPSYFVAGVIARSVIDTGWPTRFTGNPAGSLEGRPLANQIPIEAALSEATVEDLADAGIMALTCVRGRDEVLLLRAPSIHRPPQFGSRDQANAESRKLSSLPFQLLVARIAECTIRHKTNLVGDGNSTAIQQRFEQFLQAMLGDTGAGARAKVVVEPDDNPSGGCWLHCSVRTGNLLLGGTDVEFSLHT
jgi:type VI secretion system protein ImpC